MAAEVIPVANAIIAAVDLATGDWGTGDPTVLGALDGFEASKFDVSLNQGLVKNEGWTGTLDPPTATPGPRTPALDVGADLYYQDPTWRYIVAGQGSESVSTAATGVYDHDLIPASSHAGINLCCAARFPALYVSQAPHAKVTGFKLMLEQAASRGKMEATLTCFDEDVNQGTADDDLIVTSAALANGALTIAAQPPHPQILTITITGGPPTEAIITIHAVDAYGKAFTHVHTFSTDGLTGSTTLYAKDVIDAAVSGLVGTGNVKIGVSAGRGNTVTTMGNVTRPAARSPILFRGAKCYLGAQAQAGALDATNLINVEAIEIERALTANTRITTEHGDRQSEPTTGGAGNAMTKVSLKFGALTDANSIQHWRRRAATPLRMLVLVEGDFIGTTGLRETLWIWCQGLQISDGDPKPSGQGVIAYDITLEGSVVSATPTGWPASVVAPLYMRLRNAQSGKLLLP